MVEPPFSLSLNGEWGSGKTTLMKQLEQKLKEDGYPVLWFNPWEYERADDIVFCFLVKLTQFSQSKLKESLKAIGIFGLSLFANGVDLFARTITNNKLSYKNVNDLQKEIEDAFKNKYSEDPVEIIKKDFADLTKELFSKHDDNP